MPALVLKSKFILPNKVSFSSYVDYMSRTNAVYKEGDFNYLQYKEFNEYMNNPDKSTGLFTQYNNNMNDEDRLNLKKEFSKAQENDSVLWQDVFSFDNEWLKENNFLDEQNKPNVQLIQEATRKAMSRLFKEEELESSGIWSAAIHTNTGNIHVHVATVEKNNTRERRIYPDKDGKEVLGYKAVRKPLTLDHMKSSFINSLTDRDKRLEKISTLRNDLYSGFDLSKSLSKDNEAHKFYKEQGRKILKELPEDKRKWNYKNISPLAKVEIQKVVSAYKLENPKYKEYQKSIEEESTNMKKLYGKTTRESKDYAKNKEEELNYRLGNRYLKELKVQVKEIKIIETKNNINNENYKSSSVSDNKNYNSPKKNVGKIYINKKAVHQINEAMGSELKDQVDLMKYEKVQRDKEVTIQNQEMER